jgi:Xaa-Pro aminopeptidase
MSSVLNRPRAESVFGAAGVDVAIATTHANVFYLSDFRGFGQRLMPTTQVYAVARLDALGSPTVILPAGELDMAAQFPPPNASLSPYGRFFVENSPVDGAHVDEMTRYRTLAATSPQPTALGAVTAVLDADTSARIALDERGISAAARDALKTRYGDRLVDGAALFDQVRMVKTPDEIRRLTNATIVIEKAYEAALASAHEGMTEAEMTLVMDSETLRLGCDPVFSVVAFGERSALPNAVPGRRRLRSGDIIRFDIGCRSEGYYSDIARTAIFGVPSKKQNEYYSAILQGEEAAINDVRAGVPANQVFATAVEATRKGGIPHYRRHHVGHGIGLDLYDAPILNEATATPLEAGMVLEVETPYYEVGFGGLQVEDTILVTESGYRRLTSTTSELVLVG